MLDGKEVTPNAVKKGQVLMVCTSRGASDDNKKTGAWLAEFAVPYYEFQKAGYDVTLASIAGGEIPVDPTSETVLRDSEAKRFEQDEAAQQQLHHSVPLSGIQQPESYDAVFLVGGHGAIWDMPTDSKLQSVVQEVWGAGKIVASVCHGPAGLVNVVDKQTGQPLVAGKTVTCFSDAEETAMGLMGKSAPFKLESKLKELGANVSVGVPMTSHAKRDGRLITGQNNMSIHKVSELVIEALNELTASRHAAAA